MWPYQKILRTRNYLLERSVILIMFGFFAVRMYVNFKFTYSMPVLLLLIAEILPVILVLSRKWSNSPVMSTNPSDWFLALVAANARCWPPLAKSLAPSFRKQCAR